MIECQKCRAPLANNAVGCNSCGWDRPRTHTSNAPDPDWWRCIDTRDGARCSKPGTLTESTRGSPSGYHCADHFPPFRHWNVARGAPAPGTLEHIRSLTRVVAPITKPLDFEGELERAAIQAEAQ